MNTLKLIKCLYVLVFVILPLMNINRRTPHGVDPNEPHKQLIHVTSASYTSSYAYKKLLQTVVWMINRPEGYAYTLGGSYRIPQYHDLLEKDFVEMLKDDGTFSEQSFAREYQSTWSRNGEDSFYSNDLFEKHRILQNPEFEPNKKDIKTKGSFYILSVDVARSAKSQSANTVVHILKITPRSNGTYMCHVINTKTMNGEHFEEQAIKIKKLAFHYDVRQVVTDGQGVSMGLTDSLVKDNACSVTGEMFPPFSVTNNSDYDKYKTSKAVPLLFVVNATTHINSDIHVNCVSQISSGKVKFLIDEMTAKKTLLASKKGHDMGTEQQAEFLVPFVQTSILKEEMLNLKSHQEGKKLKLDRVNKSIQKDRVSSLEYALWYVKKLEDENIKDDDFGFSPSDYFFMS